MKRIIPVLFLLLFLTSCSSGVSKEQAEETALSYAHNFGRYGVDNNGEKEQVISTDIDIISTKKVEDEWYVTLRISADINGAEKAGNITVIVGNNNKVVNVLTPDPNT